MSLRYLPEHAENALLALELAHKVPNSSSAPESCETCWCMNT